MIVFSWNVRGLNIIPRQKAVHELIRVHSPDLFFIQKSKLSIEGMSNIATSLWVRGQWQCTGAQGSFGGIVFLWDPCKVTLLWWISSIFALSLAIISFESGETILFTNVYALVDAGGKASLWAHIGYVRSLAPLFP